MLCFLWDKMHLESNIEHFKSLGCKKGMAENALGLISSKIVSEN